MTTQPENPSTGSGLDLPAQELDERDEHGLPRLEIDDSTSDEQLAIESSEVMQTEDDLPAEPEPEEAPEEESEEPEAEPEPAEAPETPEQAPEPEQAPSEPPARTFTQDEVSKMQSAWMRQVNDAQREARDAKERLAAFDLQKEVEATLRQQKARLVDRLGEEEAERIVRSDENVASVKERHELTQENARLKADNEAKDAENELNAKRTTAQLLMQNLNLSADDFGTLLDAPNPARMVALAQRLAPKPAAETRERIPPATPERRPTTGRSSGQAETLSQKKQRVMEKAAWEWTEDDLKTMKAH